ncbi:hypothetical protein [Thalassobellus sediminis]|uniref:hypothetical protein n=1 Tax=Thalassobellus sediminis TaxID=3367753 RepID=UPI0037AA91BA
MIFKGLLIHIKNFEEVKQVSIYNTIGQKVYSAKAKKINSPTLKIDIETKTGNVIIVKIITTNGVINKTIIKK